MVAAKWGCSPHAARDWPRRIAAGQMPSVQASAIPVACQSARQGGLTEWHSRTKRLERLGHRPTYVRISVPERCFQGLAVRNGGVAEGAQRQGGGLPGPGLRVTQCACKLRCACRTHGVKSFVGRLPDGGTPVEQSERDVDRLPGRTGAKGRQGCSGGPSPMPIAILWRGGPEALVRVSGMILVLSGVLQPASPVLERQRQGSRVRNGRLPEAAKCEGSCLPHVRLLVIQARHR